MPRPDRLAKGLVDASLELHRRRTWKKVPADALFLIRVPTEEEWLAACLIGQGGDELGIHLVKGPDALGKMRRAFLEGVGADDDIDACDHLMVSFERLGAIPDELKGVFQSAGFQARRENIAPHLSAKPAHRLPRGLNRGEMRTLAWCLAGVFAAEDRGELRPTTYEVGKTTRKILELDVAGKLSAPKVTTRFVAQPVEARVVDLAPALLPPDLGGLERIDESWIAGLALTPGRVKGNSRTMSVALIFDQASEEIIASSVVAGDDLSPAVDSLNELIRERGRPRGLTFTSKSFMAAVASGLAGIGVPTSLDAEQPLWLDATAKLVAGIDSMHRGGQGPHVDPKTLEDWKSTDLSFTRRFVQDVVEHELVTPRATKRYFGSEVAATRVKEELEQLSVVPAFIDWLVADYRPTKRSRTYVEKRLERNDLQPVERVLLEARRDAYLSFFRVVSCVPGASFEVDDLLSERCFTVQDRALSSSDIEGWYLPLRLHRVADWYFVGVAGPPLNTFRIDRELSRLEDLGVTLEPDALRADAHLIGRTWSWYLEDQASPMKIQNTDGDPLEWHAAEFEVANPETFVRAIEARDDVVIDEPGAGWTWVREGGPGGPWGIGDTTSLCRLELFGDSLVAEVNSARRLDAARKWLEVLPGVRFTCMRAPSDGEEHARPMDDRLPGPPPEPLPPDIRQELERIMEERSLRWLDEPIPALGGLTPRAACTTKKGRGRVARLIRTMPPMGIPGGEIPAPRERLLSELGL